MLSSVIETYSELLKLKGWHIANSNEDTNLFARNHVNHGVVYVLEYGDCLKIGRTQNLSERIRSLVAQAKNYSRVKTGVVLYSASHINFCQNEKILHSAFKDKQIENGELFAMSIDEFIANIPNLLFEDMNTLYTHSSDKNVKNEIYVYAGWLNDTYVGKVCSVQSNGKEIISFEYSEDWLREHSDIFLDPDIFSFLGRQYVPNSKPIFGMLSDVCPDRWGRQLIKRRENMLAARGKRPAKHLCETDFLLAVSDVLCTGGLRFKIAPQGDFITVSNEMDIPPMADVHKIEHAALSYELANNPEGRKWLLQLIMSGSSLGGARPKANVRETDGTLWIAKFPSRNDEFDTGAWEYVIHILAKMCNLNVPEAKLQKFSDFGSTFMVKRFDRKGEQRVHFASAMNLLGAVDGMSSKYSYLDIAQLIVSHSKTPKQDIEELFRRIAFSIAVSNHDDHLRNHGFLLDGSHWQLSPLYDVNPSPDNITYMSLNITLDSSLSSFSVLLETADFYQLSSLSASQIIKSTRETVSNNWERLAKRYSIPSWQINKMRPCFEN